MNALSLRGLTKRYGEVAAVDSLDLDVERGTLYVFLGPNGAGKTTTIRMALGLVFPDAGEVELLGIRMFAAEDATVGLRRAGALIEEPAFWPWLTGRRNLECFARAAGPPADRDARLGRIDEVLDIVSLTAAASKRVKAYSQGMRQRLGLALALLGEPELLVLDEPTNGLDPTGMREIRTLLRRLADAGTTVFVSSHLLGEVEAMCDRVGVLAHGRLVAEGTPAELRSSGNRVRLEVGEPALARRVLGSLGVAEADGNGRVAAGPGTLRVSLPPRLSAAELNRALVAAGAEVSALIPENDTLEDVFLAIVEGDDAPR